MSTRSNTTCSSSGSWTPAVSEMPDIDIDICQDGRQKIIEYVREKYGHVAQIITFGTLAARAVCKDVGRVMGVPLALTDRITKLIPGIPGMTLDKAIKGTPELSSLYNSDAQVRQRDRHRQALEGLSRNAGCHAAGRHHRRSTAGKLRAALSRTATTTCSRSSKARSPKKSACSRWTSWVCARSARSRDRSSWSITRATTARPIRRWRIERPVPMLMKTGTSTSRRSTSPTRTCWACSAGAKHAASFSLNPAACRIC